MSDLPIVRIATSEKSLTVKEYRGQRVITFKEIDDFHERPKGTARRNFNANKDKFIENVDYFIVRPSDLLMYEIRTLEIPNRGLTLTILSGYLMLVKSFNDDKAWQIQRELVNKYFMARDLINNAAQLEQRITNNVLNILKSSYFPDLQLDNPRSKDLPLNEDITAYFNAIKAALESGEYFLKRKYQQDNPESGILLGVYDDHAVYLSSKLAYELYSRSVKKPLHAPILYTLLEKEGFIGKIHTRPSSVNGIEIRQITFNREKVKGLL